MATLSPAFSRPSVNSDHRTLVVERTGVVVAHSVTIARNPWTQLRGWIGHRQVAPDAALGIPFCSRIHTFGMLFALDVVYCDRNGTVLRVVAGLPPRRWSPGARGGFWAWEMPAGALAPHVQSGDRLIAQPKQL